MRRCTYNAYNTLSKEWMPFPLCLHCACLRCSAPLILSLELPGRETVHPEQVGPAVSPSTASRRDGWQPWAMMCNVTLPSSQMRVLPSIRYQEPPPHYMHRCVVMHPSYSQGLQQDPPKGCDDRLISHDPMRRHETFWISLITANVYLPTSVGF